MKFIDYMIGNLFTIFCHASRIFIFAEISDVNKLTNDPASMGVAGYAILAIGIVLSVIIVIFSLVFARKEFKKHLAEVEWCKNQIKPK